LRLINPRLVAMKAFKNIFLMLAVNIGIMVTLSILASVFGLNRYMTGTGLNYQSLAIFCLLFGMGSSFISLLISKKIAKWVYGVQLIDPASSGEAGMVYDMVARASVKAGLPKIPEVGIYDSPELNAFATGPSRSNSLVAVSTGLLRSMNKDEVEGVIGHEVAHIANGDMVTMTLIQGVMNALVMFISRVLAYAVSNALKGDNDRANPMVNFGVMIVSEIVLGIFGMMIVNWYSRKREFRADAESAAIFGKRKMIAALEALNSRSREFDTRGAQLATFKISSKKNKGMMALFSTHPALEDRIAALQQLPSM
jgi:heat shock protein HtpX